MWTRTTSSRDNWERLVAAVIKREQFRQLCRQDSITTVNSDLSERNLSFSSNSVRSVSSASPQPPLTRNSVVHGAQNFFRPKAPDLSGPALKMAVSGTLDYIYELMSSSHKHKKKKQFQTVNLKIIMDCDGCELKVKKALSSLSGVKSLEIDRRKQKVTVRGNIEQSKVLKKAKAMGRNAEIWPYIPYNLAAPQSSGLITTTSRRLVSSEKVENPKSEEPYMAMLGDDN